MPLQDGLHVRLLTICPFIRMYTVLVSGAGDGKKGPLSHACPSRNPTIDVFPIKLAGIGISMMLVWIGWNLPSGRTWARVTRQCPAGWIRLAASNRNPEPSTAAN